MMIILDKNRSVLALYKEWDIGPLPAVGDKLRFPAMITEEGVTKTKIMNAKVVDRLFTIVADEQFQEAGVDTCELTVELL
jgi:hypothetical protein